MNNDARVLILLVMMGMVMVREGHTFPLEPEPRQFVYQPGFPSVKLYPVHFEQYLNAAPNHVHLSKEDFTIMEGPRPNLLQDKPVKTESSIITMTGLPTTFSTISTTTTMTPPAHESQRTPTSTTEVKEEYTTTPKPIIEEESDTQPDQEEPVTESEMMTKVEEDVTETLPVMEEKQEEVVENVTEVPAESGEAANQLSEAMEETVTEANFEDEVTTELPDLREFEML